MATSNFGTTVRDLALGGASPEALFTPAGRSPGSVPAHARGWEVPANHPLGVFSLVLPPLADRLCPDSGDRLETLKRKMNIYGFSVLGRGDRPSGVRHYTLPGVRTVEEARAWVFERGVGARRARAAGNAAAANGTNTTNNNNTATPAGAATSSSSARRRGGAPARRAPRTPAAKGTTKKTKANAKTKTGSASSVTATGATVRRVNTVTTTTIVAAAAADDKRNGKDAADVVDDDDDEDDSSSSTSSSSSSSQSLSSSLSYSAGQEDVAAAEEEVVGDVVETQVVNATTNIPAGAGSAPDSHDGVQLWSPTPYAGVVGYPERAAAQRACGEGTTQRDVDVVVDGGVVMRVDGCDDGGCGGCGCGCGGGDDGGDRVLLDLGGGISDVIRLAANVRLTETGAVVVVTGEEGGDDSTKKPDEDAFVDAWPWNLNQGPVPSAMPTAGLGNLTPPDECSVEELMEELFPTSHVDHLNRSEPQTVFAAPPLPAGLTMPIAMNDDGIADSSSSNNSSSSSSSSGGGGAASDGGSSGDESKGKRKRSFLDEIGESLLLSPEAGEVAVGGDEDDSDADPELCEALAAAHEQHVPTWPAAKRARAEMPSVDLGDISLRHSTH